MTYKQFHNLLRVMRSIDRHELSDWVGGIEWQNFRDYPFDYFLLAPEKVSRAIWDVMVKRAPKTLDAENAIAEALDYFEDRMDADCAGDPPQFQPNPEMRIYSLLKEAVE